MILQFNWNMFSTVCFSLLWKYVCHLLCIITSIFQNDGWRICFCAHMDVPCIFHLSQVGGNFDGKFDEGSASLILDTKPSKVVQNELTVS